MSRAKAQRLLSEMLTLFDGPTSLAVESLIALLAGRNVLLSPRGHHVDNLASAIAWSFNGVLRKIPSSAALDAEAISDGQHLAHVLLIENVDTARLVKLRSVMRRLAKGDSDSCEPLFVLATADFVAIPSLGGSDHAVWDDLFGMRLNGREPVPREPATFDQDSDPLGVDQILPEDVLALRGAIEAIPLPAALASALQQMPGVLVREGWPEPSSRVLADLAAAARAVAFLRGKREVNPSHVADVLHPVVSSRLATEESLSGDLLDAVEESWDEVARSRTSGHQPAPQRKTFVGRVEDLDDAEVQSPADVLAEVSTDPLLPGPATASRSGTDPLLPGPATALRSTSATASRGRPHAPAAPPASIAEAPPIHDAYYTARQPYRGSDSDAPDPRQPPRQAPPEPEAAPEIARETPKRVRATPPMQRAVSILLLGAIVVLGTAVFPGWPTFLEGLCSAGVAEVQLWSGNLGAAGTSAQIALARVGPRSMLAPRLEAIAFLAHRAVRQRERAQRESAARSSARAGRWDEAADAYERLAKDFPEQPLYGPLAREARRRAAAAH